MFATIQYPEGSQHGQFQMFRYPGGEVQVRLTEKQITVLTGRGINEVHIRARIQDGEIMALAQLIDAIKSVTSVDIRLILPYLPYSRADRRFVSGDCNGLQTFGRILNQFAGVEIVTLDCHNPEAAKKYIRHFTDVSPKQIIETVIQSIAADGVNVEVLLPDKGAERYGIIAHSCSKLRDPETGKLTGFTVPDRKAFWESGRTGVLIIDDICDGGGTFLGIADKMKDYGLDLYLYVTHGIFSKGMNELEKRFKRIYTTDSFQELSSFPSQTLNRSLVVIPYGGVVLDYIVDRPAIWECGMEAVRQVKGII